MPVVEVEVVHDGALNCIKMRNAHTHTHSLPLGAAPRPQKCSLNAPTKRRHLFLVAAGERGQKSRKLGPETWGIDVGFLNKWYFIYFYWQMSTRHRCLCSSAMEIKLDTFNSGKGPRFGLLPAQRNSFANVFALLIKTKR